MLTITILNQANQEQSLTFDSYDDYLRQQHSCTPDVADHSPVLKVAYNGKELDYKGTYGNLYYFLLKQDLT